MPDRPLDELINLFWRAAQREQRRTAMEASELEAQLAEARQQLAEARKQLLELAQRGRAMRRKQTEYFETRSGSVLNQCRDHERRFDREVDTILNPPPPGLFGAEGGR